jgi:hypothetical protein
MMSDELAVLVFTVNLPRASFFSYYHPTFNFLCTREPFSALVLSVPIPTPIPITPDLLSAPAGDRLLDSSRPTAHSQIVFVEKTSEGGDY